MQPEDNDTREVERTCCEKVTEVQVECQNDPSLPPCLFEDHLVREGAQAVVSKVDDVVPLLTEHPHRAHRDSHVGQKLHGREPVTG